MFVMTNDGGVVVRSDSASHTPELVLIQRVLVHDLLSNGVSVILLKGAEFRDSKVSVSTQPIHTYTLILVLDPISGIRATLRA